MFDRIAAGPSKTWSRTLAGIERDLADVRRQEVERHQFRRLRTAERALQLGQERVGVEGDRRGCGARRRLGCGRRLDRPDDREPRRVVAPVVEHADADSRQQAGGGRRSGPRRPTPPDVLAELLRYETAGEGDDTRSVAEE